MRLAETNRTDDAAKFMIDAAGRGRARRGAGDMGGRDAGGRDVGGGGTWRARVGMGAVSELRRVSGFGVVGDTRVVESWAGPGRYTW